LRARWVYEICRARSPAYDVSFILVDNKA